MLFLIHAERPGLVLSTHADSQLPDLLALPADTYTVCRVVDPIPEPPVAFPPSTALRPVPAVYEVVERTEASA
ncbi:hypothetical protein [Aureimonas sp. AU40]|uniref:hypothetical protein n=1 Tax=Aureimonas sp. AU40 TaxID=1637747 RepID=UPI000A5C5E91|nr:hypothetical protein [Aureimonas sp. AU40]